MKQKRLLAVGVLLAAGCMALPALAAPAESPTPVTVSMLPAGAGAYRVTVLFPRITLRAKATDALNDLAARAHWTPSHIAWSATKAAPRFPAQTDVDFVVPSAFPNGRFPLEPFILAFKPWRTMNLLIAHGGALQFSGSTHYQTPDVIVDATPNPMSLTVKITVLNTKMQSVEVPQSLARTPPARVPRKRRGPSPLVWAILAVVAAALAWLVVYALVAPKPAKTTT